MSPNHRQKLADLQLMIQQLLQEDPQPESNVVGDVPYENSTFYTIEDPILKTVEFRLIEDDDQNLETIIITL